MIATIEKTRDQLMSLPAADRREVLLETLESSGGEFAGDILHALESVHRANELSSGSVKPLTREQAFSRARIAVR